MKYISVVLFLFFYTTYSQCGQYAQIKNERLSHVRFWNEQNGFVIGGASLLTTTNGGSSWSAYDVRDFQRLTVNPLNEAQILNTNTALIVGDDGIILRTEDQGLTWQRDIVRLGGVFDYKDIYFINENIGYITGNYFNSANQEQIFLYKTTNGGDTWSEVLLTFPSTSTERIVNEIYFINENVGFMSTLGAFSGMFKTIDGGDNWVDIDPEFDGFYTNFQFISDQIGYAMAGDTVIKTNNGGESWTELSLISHYGFSIYNNYLYLNESNYGQTRRFNLLSSNIESVEVGIHGLKRDTFFVNNTVGYAVGQKENGTPSLGRFILKTVDGGNTWSILDGIGTVESGTSGNANDFSKMSDNEFIYSYTTSQYGTGSYILKSSDNAVSWQLIQQYDDVIGETLFVDENYISYLRPSNPDNGADNMIFSESTDGGETWQDITVIDAQILSPFNTNQQISVNEIFSSNFSDLRYSNDKGQTWQTITIPAGYELWDYHFVNDQTGYITLQDFSVPKTTFYKTENRGASWEEIISFTGEDSFPGYNFKVTSGNKLVIYPSQNTGMLYLYENNTIIEKPFDFFTAKFQIINDNTFMLVNNDFELFISYDSGDNWVQRFFINTDFVIPEIFVESEESIFLWKYNYIEQLKNYYPDPPDVIKGEIFVQVGQSYAYDVPLNLFTYLEWDATDGLITSNINNNAVRATVRWLSPGIHYVRARYVNECGPSEYAELQVNVAPLNIDNDNFLITTTSETCLETNNGIINISADQSYNYSAIINGQTFNFNTELTIEDLAPGNYELCITVPPTTFEQCYNVVIESADSLTGRIESRSLDSVEITIETGTPPFKIYKNDQLLQVTDAKSIILNASEGDQFNVLSKNACEGELNMIYFGDGISVFPNATNGITKLVSSYSLMGKTLMIYTVDGRLVQSRHITTHNAIDIDVSNEMSGVYFLRIGNNTKDVIKLIKL